MTNTNPINGPFIPTHMQHHAIALQLLAALGMTPDSVASITSPGGGGGLWKVRGMFGTEEQTAVVQLSGSDVRAYKGRDRRLAVTGTVLVDTRGQVYVNDVIAPIGRDSDD